MLKSGKILKNYTTAIEVRGRVYDIISIDNVKVTDSNTLANGLIMQVFNCNSKTDNNHYQSSVFFCSCMRFKH